MSRWTLEDVVAAKQRMERVRVSDEIEAQIEHINKTAIAKNMRDHGSKYGNRKTNGYASKREAKRAEELKRLQTAGFIRNLREQVSFELVPKQEGERACKYVADFCYDEPNARSDGGLHWLPVVEDAKGYRDPVYRIKRKLMLKVHGIRIREV